MSRQDMSYHQTIVEELPHTLEAARWSLTFNQGTSSVLYILLIYVDEIPGLAEGLEDKGSKPRAKEWRRKSNRISHWCTSPAGDRSLCVFHHFIPGEIAVGQSLCAGGEVEAMCMS